MKDVSVIVTAYNAEATIARALSSAADRRFSSRVEVIVVDDFSRDRTGEIIARLCSRFDNIRSVHMPHNTGSPSRPRNKGIALATAEYVVFLDDDDYIDAERLLRMVDHARAGGIDFLKGYLKKVQPGSVEDACMLFDPPASQKALIGQIIASQSTMSAIIRREFLVSTGVLFDEAVKVGEDTLFHTGLLSFGPRVGYVHDFFQFYCRQAVAGNLSSTQEYADRALNNHIGVWQRAEANLRRIGLSYYALRLPAALQLSLMSIVSYSRGRITEPCFRAFSDFVRRNQKYLKGTLHLHPRYGQLYAAVLGGDYGAFREVSAPRLLVAGVDTDWSMPLMDGLSGEFAVAYDRWPSGSREPAGKELLDWADIIWCRGMDECAAWYSRHKLSHQVLIVQTLGDDGPVGDVDFAQVDCLTAPTFYHKHRLCAAHGIEEHSVVIFNPAEARTEAGGAGGGIDIVVGFGPESREYAGVMDALRAFADGDNGFVLNADGPAEGRRVLTLHAAPGWDDCVQSVFHAVRSGSVCLMLSRPGAEYCWPPRMLFDSMGAMLNEMRRLGHSPAANDEAYASMRDFVEDYYSEARSGAELRAILEQARL